MSLGCEQTRWSCGEYAGENEICGPEKVKAVIKTWQSGAGKPSGSWKVPSWMYLCAGMTANGDPHVVNILGQKFDIFTQGDVELIRFPQGAADDDAKIVVTASITKLGKSCHDSYMKKIRVSGAWLQGEVSFKDDEDTGEVLVSSHTDASIPPAEWTRMNGTAKSQDQRIKYATPKKVEFHLDDQKIKVVIFTAGRMHQGVGTYLNLDLDGFGSLEGKVGGMLGVDDHSKEKALGKLLCQKNATKETALHSSPARALHVITETSPATIPDDSNLFRITIQ